MVVPAVVLLPLAAVPVEAPLLPMPPPPPIMLPPPRPKFDPVWASTGSDVPASTAVIRAMLKHLLRIAITLLMLVLLAISAVDCALWDLRGRWLDQPVYRLLGGPTRAEVPAYASMLGFSVQDLDRVRERAIEYRERGYQAQKWFFRHGPGSGYEGLRANVDLVRTVREAVGDDYDIMFDCWQSMDVSYVSELAARIAHYRPRWLEEVAMPDRIDSYRLLRDRLGIPLAGAEHEYTRWGFRRFVDAGITSIRCVIDVGGALR